jgi:formyltetrahydrofolate-dependent phosphoribosylglycinamide formyltransferase
MANWKEKWKVNNTELVLIISTFALGGSLCGYTGRKLLSYVTLNTGFFYYVVYFVLITFLWPLCVLVVSIPLGQFGFFKNYLRRIRSKLMKSKKIKTSIESPISNQASSIFYVAIFASGTGTNAQKIIEYFKHHPSIKISLVVCNKPDAGVLKTAEQHYIPTLLIKKEQFFRGDAYVAELKIHHINFIVLAGFLWKVPAALIQAYPNKIINIHPALLPKYGGKGMYGHFVHEAVIANKEKESGITIHYVNEQFDEGEIIFQATCAINVTDTSETLAQKVHVLEHEHFASLIEQLLSK